MSFADEMKQVYSDYEYEVTHKDEKEVEEVLKKIKSYIRAQVARGEKLVSEDDSYLFSINQNQPEFFSFSAHKGLTKATIRWSLTQKTKEKLEKLRTAAAKEEITITGFSFTLYVWGNGDNNRCGRFSEDHGVLYIPKRDLGYEKIGSLEWWSIHVSCSFRYSL